MFTGIVENQGEIIGVDETDRGRSLLVALPGLDPMAIGASVAINGVCLTVVENSETGARFTVVPETLSRTNLRGLHIGDSVNVERPMAADGRFEGHIVQGHVDGLGQVVSVGGDDGGVVMRIQADPAILRHVVEKGSITVDGVSLTVVSVDGESFTIALIPHTLDMTTLGRRKPGDTVNLETDVLAKYVDKMLQVRS